MATTAKVINEKVSSARIGDLKPHPRNPRRGDLEIVRESIEANGFYGYIVAQHSTGFILAGNHRFMAARDLGFERVPVAWVDVDDETAMRILLADNRTSDLATYDESALEDLLRDVAEHAGTLAGTGYDDSYLKRLLGDQPGEDPGSQVDRGAELLEKWKVERGQVWTIGDHRLMCGDCTDAGDVQLLMQGAEAALMLTDPPYNIGYEYESDDDKKPREEYAAFCRTYMELGSSISRMQIVTPGKQNVDLYDPADAMTWYKGFAASGGSFYHASVTEPILAFGAKPKGAKYPTDHFDFGTDRIEGLRDLHSCPKPIGLFEALLEPMAEPGEIVYDAFSGSGTTWVACLNLGRVFHGIEIEPKYVAATLERVEQISGEMPVQSGAKRGKR